MEVREEKLLFRQARSIYLGIANTLLAEAVPASSQRESPIRATRVLVTQSPVDQSQPPPEAKLFPRSAVPGNSDRQQAAKNAALDFVALAAEHDAGLVLVTEQPVVEARLAEHRPAQETELAVRPVAERVAGRELHKFAINSADTAAVHPADEATAWLA